MAKFIWILLPVEGEEPEVEDLEITTAANLTVGTVGEQYRVDFGATGGSTPYSWSTVSGSIPTGLTALTSAGVLTGTPTVAGTYNFTVRATDSAGVADTADLACILTVLPAAVGVTVVNTVLTGGVVGVVYTETLTATGGTGPYTFQHVSGKPSWMTIAGNGDITGTPDAAAVSSIIVTATDSLATVSPQKTLTLTVVAALSMTTTSPLASGTVGIFYNVTLSGAGGITPYTWSELVVDTLPDGLSINPASGVISGTPTVDGVFSTTIRLADNGGSTPIDRAFNITIAAAPSVLTIVDTTIPGGTVGTSYPAKTIQAVGGTAPYTWSELVADTLPDGLSIGPTTGVITGNPTLAGTFSFTLKVVDAVAAEAFSGSFTVVITQAALAISTANLVPGEVNDPYTDSIIAVNGTLPYVYSSPDKPSWMTVNAGTGAITGTPDAEFDSTLTLRVIDANGAGTTVNRTVGLRIFPEGQSEGYRGYFNTYSVHPNIFRSVSWRSQTEIDRWSKNQQPNFGITYHTSRAADPHAIAPDGAKMLIPPRSHRRDRDSYPSGARTYNTRWVANGFPGNEGLNNDTGNLKVSIGATPVGATPTGDWTSLVIVWDMWWDETYSSQRGGLDGYKFFFLKTGDNFGGNENFGVVHGKLGSSNLTLGNVGGTFLQGAAGSPFPAGVTQAGGAAYLPTGLDAYGNNAYRVAANKWTRYWYEVRFNIAGADFTDWIALGGAAADIGSDTGSYATATRGGNGPLCMVSLWAANEGQDVERIIYRVPMRFNETMAGQFHYSWDQSNPNHTVNEIQRFNLGDIVAGNSFTITVPAYTNTRLSVTSSQETTAAITLSAANANLSIAINDALEALTWVDGTTVTRVGTTGQIYDVIFWGAPNGATGIPACTVTPTGFTPGTITRRQPGGVNFTGQQGGVQICYLKDLLIFKNLAQLDDTDPDFFARPVSGDAR